MNTSLRSPMCQALLAPVFAIAVHHLPASAADVSFRAAFEAAAGQDVISISVPASDTLVFDGGAFYSQGRRIIVVAAQARATGETTIGFFAPDSRPAPKSGVAATGAIGAAGAGRACGGNGCDGSQGGMGATGTTGDTGAAATTIVFDIAKLAGDGKVRLLGSGQAGGKGQKAGKGGTGGGAGEGAQRSCGGFLGLDTRSGPGNGGTGGTGGTGGVGGTGGKGGSGGFVAISANLAPFVKSGRIIADLTPAAGGPGGDAGDPGDPGAGGGMGGGNSCGGGGSSGNGGSNGATGTGGDTGAVGEAGTLRYLASEDAKLEMPTQRAEPGKKNRN